MRITARQVDRGVRRARARAETRQPRYEAAIRQELRRLFDLAASRFSSRATEHLTAGAVVEGLDATAREVGLIAEKHAPEGGYGDTAWNEKTGTVFWVCADWTTNDELDAAEADFLSFEEVKHVEREAEAALPTGDGWQTVYTSAALTAAGEGPGWTPPADDELLALDEIVSGLRGKTDPVRQSAVADYFAAFGASPGIRGIRASWDVTNPLIAHHLERVGSQITEVSETTRTNVRGIIARAYAEGFSIPDTAAAIRSAGADLSASRAALIARTEFVGLVNGGSLAAVQVVSRETGDGYLKRWLTAPGAEYPRHEDYDDLDGQTVPLDGMFVVGGELLAYPGDPDGEPAEVCNCRCDLEYVEQRGPDSEE